MTRRLDGPVQRAMAARIREFRADPSAALPTPEDNHRAVPAADSYDLDLSHAYWLKTVEKGVKKTE